MGSPRQAMLAKRPVDKRRYSRLALFSEPSYTTIGDPYLLQQATLWAFAVIVQPSDAPVLLGVLAGTRTAAASQARPPASSAP